MDASTRGARDEAAPPLNTRQLILEVARREISERGIDGASIRSIARAADVDPGLVRHYFGSREGMLLQAVRVDSNPHALAEQILRGSHRTIGRRTAEALLDRWVNPRTATPYRARLSAALTNPEIAKQMESDVITTLFGLLAAACSPDRHTLRATLAASVVLGVALSQHIVEEPELADADRADVTRMVGRAIQQYLTADLDLATEATDA